MDQELSSMYDYLAKIILLGPSGSGKSCILHRFVKNEWRVLSSQTIGVEFASKVVKVGTGSRRKRIKLQLWDTAGTERFRAVSRSYYRGAAAAILVYDITSHTSFRGLPTFLNDARALTSPNLPVVLAGNKCDLTASANDAEDRPVASESLLDKPINGSPASAPATTAMKVPGSRGSQVSTTSSVASSYRDWGAGSSHHQTATEAMDDAREVGTSEAAAWASTQGINVAVEVSALSGEGVEEVFNRLAGMILAKIELGEIDPDDPRSGIQYGGGWDAGSTKSGMTVEDTFGGTRRRRGAGWVSGLREWEEVFRLDGRGSRRRGCC